MTIRIVHLGKFYHPHSGGIETHVRTLAQIQARNGAEVHVVCIAHDEMSATEFWDGPVFVRRFKPRLSAGKFDWLPGLTRYLDDLNCDILHIQLPNPAMTIAVLGMKTNKAVVATHQSDIVGMPIRQWLFNPFQQRILSRASIIAVSNPRMAESSPCLRAHREKVCVVPLGIALERFQNPDASVQQAAERIRRATPGPLWMMCGRLVPYKGHSVALRALAATPGTLVVIGDGPLRNQLRLESARLGVSDRVQFLGHVPDCDIAAYYRAATALWMPSILPSEAFGLVQVEAMASGCPVINTDIAGSGVPWVSVHELTGLTVPVGDSAALAAAATRLTNSATLHEELSCAARERAKREFCHKVMHVRWMREYERCLNNERLVRWATPFPIRPRNAPSASVSTRGELDVFDSK